MIIYKCLITGDELFSDIYKITSTKDNLFYEVEGKYITRKADDIDDSLIGGNASAEEVNEGTDSSSTSDVDIVLNHNLQITIPHTKKSITDYLKTYVNLLKAKIEETDPDKISVFKSEANSAAKQLRDMVSNNKNLKFYTGSSMNPDGCVGILDYREDGITPFMLFMKWGLEEEKC